MRQRMDGQASSNVSYYPGLANVERPEEKPIRLPWWLRVTHWLGVTMPQPERPNGWSLNPATITLALVVAGGILTGGFLWGENVTERRHLMQRITEAEKKAEDADTKATYAVSGRDKEDGHGPNANRNPK